MSFKKMTKVLLTGGTGFIGSHTAVVLSQAGYDVVLLDNFSNSSESVLKKIAQILGRDLPFIFGDVQDTLLLENVLKQESIDAIIHFAGLKSVADSVQNSLEYYKNNLDGIFSILNALQKTSCKNLIFSSSATVYGLPCYLPFDEKHPTSPINPYGRSKLYAENILSDFLASNLDYSFIALRYFNPIGAHPSGLIGEYPKGVPNNLLPYISQVAKGKRDFVSIFGDDYPTKDGTGVRDYIHVMDLANGHLAALNYSLNHRGWEVFNLGTGFGYSVLDVINSFQEACGQKIPVQIKGRRLGDIAEFFSNPSKAENKLGWKAKFDIHAMCLSQWLFEKNQ